MDSRTEAAAQAVASQGHLRKATNALRRAVTEVAKAIDQSPAIGVLHCHAPDDALTTTAAIRRAVETHGPLDVVLISTTDHSPSGAQEHTP